jgi:tRNA A-37 threonylcarbamoyl transferase component Bud32
MAPKHEDQLIGKTFEKCRILAKLGTGGMGSVWLAEHFGLGRKVAVKILPPEMGRDPEYVARFMREATTAGRMEHRNIVQIHDVGYAEGRHFIVMQYVDGESLSTIVENLGAMDPRDAAKITAGMLRGLQHAHEAGVVHRDVKPDNVLITKGDEPKLLDFGLAIETETALQITKDGMVVGTPYYLAPEQARGQKATPLCDVYAAGVTLYYMITGKRPFVGATALAVLNKHIHEPPIPPMKHKADIPKPLNDIVLKMMAKKPADRYPSAAAAASDLEAFLKGKQIAVRLPRQLPLGLDRLTRKQQIIAAASAGVGLFVLLVLIIAAFSGGGKADPGPGSDPVVVKPPAAPLSPEREGLKECLQFETDHRDKIDDFAQIFSKYDQYIVSTTSADFIERGKAAKKAFYDYVEKRGVEELDKIVKETDPYKRVKLLAAYPQPLVDLTTIGKRLGSERSIAASEAETKSIADEKQAGILIKQGKFKEAGDLLDLVLSVAEGPRRERVGQLKNDLPRLQTEFEDSLLRRLTDGYAAAHAAFTEALSKRETHAAYNRITKFLQAISDPAERERARVTGLNYETLFHGADDRGFKESIGTVQLTLATTFVTAKDTLAYHALSDLQDALDVEALIKAAQAGLEKLSITPKNEIHFVTLNQSGRMIFNQNGPMFQVKAGGEKKIDPRTLYPPDLLTLAAASEGLALDKTDEISNLLSRAIGSIYLHSSGPERWAQAIRWYKRAEGMGVQGLGFRIAGLRERGYQEVLDRVAASKTLLDKKKFDEAKQPLAAIQGAWDHDSMLKEMIGRSMASILVSEILHHDRVRDYAKVKQAARALRGSYLGLYRDEDIFGPYATALRMTGNWGPAGSLLNDEWTWEGKGQGKEAPVLDETKQSRGFRLRPEKSLEFSSATSRGASGATAALSIANTQSSFATGFRFDASSKDGKYRKLVLHDTGEVALYEVDGLVERRSKVATLGKKIGAGEWIELTYVAEGGDLICFVGDRPVFLESASIPTDRTIALWSSAETNFRFIRLRK